MISSKPTGTIQVDVDDLWVYYESIGRRAPAGCPSPAYTQGVPRLLDLFERRGIRATFFVCGRDAQAQRAMLREMVRRGHEVANHSTWHRPGFASLSTEEKRADIATTHQLLADAAGVEPRGFKSPGFSFAPDQLDVLAGLDYRYDSSLLPTFYAPLMRTAQRFLSGGTVDPTHYGQARYGLAPLRPYTPSRARPHQPETNAASSCRIAPRGRSGESRTGTRPYPTDAESVDYPHDRRIASRGRSGESRTGTRPYPTDAMGNPNEVIEAPVTTMPLTRLPMHSTFVFTAGRLLFDAGLALATARKVPVNYLLHAADAIDPVADPVLASYRFLTMPWSDKRAQLEHMLAKLSAAYQLVPTIEYVDAVGK
ncbi:MAG: polysaccharide deacetylase family protein [Caldilineales bacterium]